MFVLIRSNVAEDDLVSNRFPVFPVFLNLLVLVLVLVLGVEVDVWPSCVWPSCVCGGCS